MSYSHLRLSPLDFASFECPVLQLVECTLAYQGAKALSEIRSNGKGCPSVFLHRRLPFVVQTG